jgi:hypothetical protein
LACKKEEEQEVPVAPPPPPPTIPGASDPAPAGDSLAGAYTITSATNPGSDKAYTGTVNIREIGGHYQLNWVVGSERYSGVGIEQNGMLGVGWGMGQSYGVVVYEVDGGALSGRWASSKSGDRLGTETLKGPAGLTGTYTVDGKSEAGTAYEGEATINKNGETYPITWKLKTGESYSGVGILEGKTFVVGWGIGGATGAVIYRLDGKNLDGKWAAPKQGELGTEKLSRI